MDGEGADLFGDSSNDRPHPSWHAECYVTIHAKSLRLTMNPTIAAPYDGFPLTEAGDAEFFAEVHGHRLRFDHRQGRWLIFDDHRWSSNTSGRINPLALDSMRLRQQAAFDVSDPKERTKHMEWALRGESSARMRHLLQIATSLEPISDAGDGWDRDPWLMGVPNGTLDLRTGMLRAGSPADLITMCAGVAYDPAATCPRWRQLFREVFDGDVELIWYVQRALGYSLVGDTREQCLFMTWGTGANGKSTLMSTVFHVLGDYAADLPFSALELQERTSIPNDIAKLVGKRFVTSAETNRGSRLNVGRVKALTGCDALTARFLHHEFFTFQPVAKFWLATNHKPIVTDSTHGYWRRVRLIPFTRRFEGKSDNKGLREELTQEAAGILTWLVEGCIAWQAEGLIVPAAVRAATETYRAESDSLRSFLEDRCIQGKELRSPARPIFLAYQMWVRHRPDRAMNQTEFGTEMKSRFEHQTRRNTVTYLGVALRSPSTSDPEVVTS